MSPPKKSWQFDPDGGVAGYYVQIGSTPEGIDLFSDATTTVFTQLGDAGATRRFYRVRDGP